MRNECIGRAREMFVLQEEGNGKERTEIYVQWRHPPTYWMKLNMNGVADRITGSSGSGIHHQGFEWVVDSGKYKGLGTLHKYTGGTMEFERWFKDR